MKFNTLIIGGGLAGLTCGIRLAENGIKTLIVSQGQSALAFASGAVDLLNYLPDGTPVHDMSQGLQQLATQAPAHPYSKIGAANVLTLAAQGEQLLADAGLQLHGERHGTHRCLTPIGRWHRTWLSPRYACREADIGQTVTVATIAGFLDFEPANIMAALSGRGIACRQGELTLPLLDTLRANPSEFRSVNIARVLDNDAVHGALLHELRQIAGDSDTLILPACLGLDHHRVIERLQQGLSCRLLLVPTLPPSVPGITLQRTLEQRFRSLGGTLLSGDSVRQVLPGESGDYRVFTRNHGDIALKTRQLVLASGSFFSNGLAASRTAVTETLFGLDLIAPGLRADWYGQDFFHRQPWQSFGVTTDNALHPSKDGVRQPDLFAIGGVLGGFDPITEGCGGGVSVISALHAAGQIIQRQEGLHEPR